MYAEEYDGYFPPQDGAEGLELLRKSGILENPHMYTCYDSNRYKAARNGQPLKENNVGFVYRGGLRSDSPPVTAVAWDKPFNYDKFGYILFVDGHVSGYAGANWMDNIK